MSPRQKWLLDSSGISRDLLRLGFGPNVVLVHDYNQIFERMFLV